MPSSHLLRGCRGHPAQMPGHHGTRRLPPGETQRDQLRLQGHNDSTNPVRQQEVRLSASRYTNRKASPLVLHHGRPFSYGRQPRQPTDELLPDPGHSEVTQNRNGVKVSSWA